MTQPTFFGASVIGYECSVGWNEQSSQLVVNLVEDPANGDSFVEPTVGMPCYFNHNGWIFGGIVQSWEAYQDPARTFSIMVVDPREILGNISVVIGGYLGGTLNIPNFINPYGYLENVFGLGFADVNEGGMPWNKIRAGIVDIFQDNATNYGSQINFRGYPYLVDLSNLPIPPNDYRFTGVSRNLLEMITELCQDCSCDFYVSLENIGTANIIKPYITNRFQQPIFGKISDFVSSTNGAIAKQIGVELRNENTTTVLVGGQVERLYAASGDFKSFLQYNTVPITNKKHLDHARFLEDRRNGVITNLPQFPTPQPGNPPNNNPTAQNPGEFKAHYLINNLTDGYIWPYWGVNEEYDAVIGTVVVHPGTQGKPFPLEDTVGEMLHDRHTFTLDARNVDVAGVGATYTMDAGECRAALENQDAWRAYIVWRSILALQNNITADPYYGRHLVLGMQTQYQVDENVKNHLASGWGRVQNTINTRKQKALYDGLATESTSQQNIDKLYGYVKTFADEHYGKKFMVQLPVSVRRDPQTQKLYRSHEPIDAAYVAENDTPLGLSVTNQELFRTPEGKILAFARFSPASGLDLSAFDKNDYVVENNVEFIGSSVVYNPTNSVLFLKCTVEPDFVFRDFSSLSSPRAVVTLPNPVFYKRNNYDINRNFEFYRQVMAFVSGEIPTPFKVVGAKEGYALYSPIAAYPEAIVVPLKDNTNVYGPWYKTGVPGKVNFEQDESLVPWNYGGFPLLNAAAANKLLYNSSNMQADETGSIELPGAPPVTIGAALVSGGPAVTNISVSVGREGVKTRLTLKTFTPQFGSLAKRNADKFSTIGKLLQQHQRNIRNLLRTPRSGSAAGRAKYIAREASYHRVKHYLGYREGKDKPGTPHSMLVGCPYVPLDGSGLSASVVTETLYEALPDFRASVSGEYNLRAGMSWEGLLRPFSTSYTASGLPHFERPGVSGKRDITVDKLNPFKTDHDIEYVVRGNEYPVSGLSVFEGDYDSDNNYRPLALRGPVIITGWGYTTGGKPVPNSGQFHTDGSPKPSGKLNESFLDGYLRKFDTWKTGPLDTRWDDRRKVWVAGGGEQRVVRILDTNAYPSGDNAPKLGPSGLTAFEPGVKLHYPSGRGLNVYYAQEMEVDFEEFVTKNHGSDKGPFVTVSGTDNYLYVGNFRNQVVIPSSYFLVSNINGKWFIENQATFLEYM